MSLTKEEVCAQACVLLGLEPISSFDDGTAEANALKVAYETSVQALLSAYPWRFASTQTTIASPLADTPQIAYAYAFQRPNDILVLRGCYWGDQPVPYDVVGDKIFADVTADLQVEYLYRADEAYWPPYFTEMVKSYIAAFLLGSVAEKPDMAKLELEKFQMWEAKAKAADSQSRPARPVRTGRLLAGRRSFGSGISGQV